MLANGNDLPPTPAPAPIAYPTPAPVAPVAETEVLRLDSNLTILQTLGNGQYSTINLSDLTKLSDKQILN